MNVLVHTVDGEDHDWDHVEVTFDTTVLQIVNGAITIVFPLGNVIAFSIDQSPS